MNQKCNKGDSCDISMPATRNCTAEVLEQLDKNVNMATESITDIMPKIKNTDLTAFLTSQLNEYSKFSEEIKAQIKSCGAEIKPTGMIAKMSTKIGIEMNTLKDDSDAHIAEMMIEGNTKGMVKSMRQNRALHALDPKVSSLSNRLLQTELTNIEQMKPFL